MKNFTHADLKLPKPEWDTEIIGKLMELSRLRDRRLYSESFDIFWALKNIFQDLENWASARIEGNQTELIDALSHDVNDDIAKTADYQELRNLRKATEFIDGYLKEPTSKIDENFILDIHKLVVGGLPVGTDLPGDATPGKLRTKHVIISKSNHVPPIGVKVKDYFSELTSFINEDHGKENDFFKVSIAHHRFTWVHPFTNGNGRVARLLTYAMLQKLGYGVQRAHILNPSLVFYSDRKRYYDNLAIADKGTNAGLLKWSEYFIEGLLEEINKIDRLLNDEYVKNKILIPVVQQAYEGKRIGEQEYKILLYSFNNPEMTFVSGDINIALGLELSPVTRARLTARMKKDGVIVVAIFAKQKYFINLTSSLMSRYVENVLFSEGFIRVPDPIK
jgi:Fic family protein